MVSSTRPRKPLRRPLRRETGSAPVYGRSAFPRPPDSSTRETRECTPKTPNESSTEYFDSVCGRAPDAYQTVPAGRHGNTGGRRCRSQPVQSIRALREDPAIQTDTVGKALAPLHIFLRTACEISRTLPFQPPYIRVGVKCLPLGPPAGGHELLKVK